MIKTKPAHHLQKNDVVVFTNATSGKETAFKVMGQEVNEEFTHPVRIYLSTPEPWDAKTTTVVGFGWREQVKVQV